MSSVKQYRYTVENPYLSIKQRDFYEENGFLVIRNLIAPHYLQKYHDRFVDICHGRVQETGHLVAMKDISLRGKTSIDPERVVNKVQNYQFDDVLSTYFKLPEVLKYVECFVGKDIAAVHTMLINKPPDAGTKSSRHPLHQDLHYFPFRPADRIVCSWTAMQKVTRDNGCLVVVPGSHKGTLLRHEYPDWEGGVNKMYHGIDARPYKNNLVYLEMEAGDTVLFHPILIHGSGSNKTDGFRKAISCHFSTCNSHYIEVDGTSQENISKEVIALAKKKLPEITLTIQDVWEILRVVVQKKSNL